MKFSNILILLGMTTLVGCGVDHIREDMETSHPEDRKTRGAEKFLGHETLKFGGTKKRSHEETGIGVNSYLWRASLDTVSFMPISSADPFGGVILTDWFSPSATENERFKINILLLSRQLRSDGLKVSIFRQEKNSEGHWVDQTVDEETVTELENTILTRARHFHSTAVK
jgi:hypothetical protein